MPLLSADHLNVSLDGTPILHDVSFAVQDGSWVGLLGPNGSGKSTLLRAVSGLLDHTGTLLLHGRPVRSWKPRELARHIAFMRQSVPLSFDFTVEDLVLLGRTPHKGWLEPYHASDRARVQQALARVDVAMLAGRSVLSLSGGERQRVFLAQALAQDTTLLLLDEPTAHLDVHYQYEFLHIVRDLVAEGRTIITVFHDIEQAARFADQLLVLHRGRLVATGPPQAVLTEALLASVFRMQARLETAEDGTLRVFYLQPV